MEGEWTEYEYIDEEDLAQPDFYVDQFYPTGGLQVSAKFPFTMTSMDPKSTLGHLALESKYLGIHALISQDDMEDEMGGGLAPFSVSEIMEHCIEPTVTDGLKHMGKIIVWCLLFRIVTQTVEVCICAENSFQNCQIGCPLVVPCCKRGVWHSACLPFLWQRGFLSSHPQHPRLHCPCLR